MSDKLKSTLRLVSVVIVLILILLQFQLVPVLGEVDRFWPLVAAYGLLLYTLK